MGNTAGWKWKFAQKLEYRWWQRYLRNKDTGEYLQWKTKYWKDLLASVEPYTPVKGNLHILDAGCGPAGIFIALEGNTVEAIDPLLDKYKDLPHFQPQQFPWTQFRNIPIESLDDTGRFDLIFCLNAINHVNDIELCCNNLIRALKPGGYLVMSTDAHRYRFLKGLFQLIPGDMLHPVQLDIKEYEALLHQKEMAIVKNILYKREPIFDYYIMIARKS